jgi:hypothetical protein
MIIQMELSLEIMALIIIDTMKIMKIIILIIFIYISILMKKEMKIKIKMINKFLFLYV